MCKLPSPVQVDFVTIFDLISKILSTITEESVCDHHLLLEYFIVRLSIKRHVRVCLVSIFVVVARICFNVDIFPLVIVLIFHLTSVLNFCLALLEKYMIWSQLRV